MCCVRGATAQRAGGVLRAGRCGGTALQRKRRFWWRSPAHAGRARSWSELAALAAGVRIVTEPVLPTALAFARHGHAVFPVNWPVEHKGRLICSCGSELRGRPCSKNAAKHPYGKLAPHGLRSATTEAGIIKHWFGYQAPRANLGVVTDRLVVVDVDPRHGGDESFAAIEREHGKLPPTWRVLTGG